MSEDRKYKACPIKQQLTNYYTTEKKYLDIFLNVNLNIESKNFPCICHVIFPLSMWNYTKTGLNEGKFYI